jgi:serralysin
MATVKVFNGFDFTQAQDWDWDQLAYSSTRLSISNGYQTQQFAGRFTYYDDFSVTGTVTSTSLVVGNKVQYSVSGMSDSAAVLAEYAQNFGDTQESYAYVLRGNDTITGSRYADVLLGYAGDDWIDGGLGIDTLVGGTGNDTYVLDDAAELLLVKELVGEGNDTLRIAYKNTSKTEALNVDLSISNLVNVENVTITGTGLFNITGNNLGNTLTGNASANIITGGTGNDILDGKNGGDTLIGGAGDDTYFVYSDKDDVQEQLNGGTDTVNVVAYAKNTYTLEAHIENAVAYSKAALNLTGNALANTLTGNAAANILDGGEGAGVDTLKGGKGNDTYIVRKSSDIVIERVNEGTDTVKSAASSYTLADNVENLTLIDGALSGTGNGLKNIITGNGLANVLDGGAGVDRLVGGAGDDTYVVDLIAKGSGTKATVALEDTVVEKAGQGDDTLVLRMGTDAINAFTGKAAVTLGANLENLDASGTGNLNLSLTGNAGNNLIIGNLGDNTLNGGAGDDQLQAGAGGLNTLIGGLGADTMFGNSGKDTFKFNTLKELGLNDKQDVIHNFTSGIDQLDFSALKGYKLVQGGAFTGGAKELVYQAVGNDLVVYGTHNADKVADFSIKLVGITELSVEDFSL